MPKAHGFKANTGETGFLAKGQAYLRGMTIDEATKLLDAFRAGKASRQKVLSAFRAAPVANLGFAQVDTHRALRKGFPEVIFGAGKTPTRW